EHVHRVVPLARSDAGVGPGGGRDRGRRRHPQPAERDPHPGRLHLPRQRHGRRGHRGGAGPPADRHDPRHQPAGHRRLRGRPSDPGLQQHLHHHAVGARRGDRHLDGPRRRGRRLPHQTLPPARAARADRGHAPPLPPARAHRVGRPGPRHTGPHHTGSLDAHGHGRHVRRERRRGRLARAQRAADQRGDVALRRRRRARRAHPQRVRPAAGDHAGRPPGDQQGRARPGAAGRLRHHRLRLGLRQAGRRGAHGQPAPQAQRPRRGPALHRDGARGGLPARRRPPLHGAPL
ncbi:MAG: Phosphate regulon transcriptional regulatory protein PhoB (SphR), partial [uncultured Friedmanniella sp.]